MLQQRDGGGRRGCDRCRIPYQDRKVALAGESGCGTSTLALACLASYPERRGRGAYPVFGHVGSRRETGTFEGAALGRDIYGLPGGNERVRPGEAGRRP